MNATCDRTVSDSRAIVTDLRFCVRGVRSVYLDAQGNNKRPRDDLAWHAGRWQGYFVGWEAASTSGSLPPEGEESRISTIT